MTTVQVEYAQHVENARHNVASEVEANRHNVVTEKEAHRAAVKKEKQTTRSLKLESKKVREQKRHNKVTEKQTDRSQTEIERANRANESNSRYAADTSAAGRVTAATISAEASKYAADTSAEVQRYIAELRDYQAKLDREAANARNSQNAATNIKITNANNFTKEVINSANIAQQAIAQSDKRKHDQALERLEKERNEIQEAYNNDRITQESFKILKDLIDDIIDKVIAGAAAGLFE